MIFTSSSNLKSELLVFYSYQHRPGKWSQPEPVEAINRSLPINHIGGYSLSYDGNYIFFTSRKSYGIGQFDIWYCKKTSRNQWSPPVNMAKPVNSTLDDGCPSLSPDGNTMYFVRCKSMDLKEGNDCKLMVAEKRNRELWGEPVELPDYINDGNIMSPRILADNQTLIYAKFVGGQWDLYQTRWESGKWTKPMALDYVNTDGDERFASIPAQGEIIYYSGKYKGTYDIIKARIPEQMQPLKIVYLKGGVVDAKGNPMVAFIQVYDVEQKKLVQYHRTDRENTSFELYLAAGKQYDFSVVPLEPGFNFYSEIFDLTTLTVSTRRKLDIVLDNFSTGMSFPLQCLTFENDSTLSKGSRFELSRVIKLLKNNPGTKFEIAVHRESWDENTLPSEDSSSRREYVVSESSLDIVDTLSIEQDEIPLPLDPTEERALAITTYLEQRGVPDYVLDVKGYADTEPLTTSGDPDSLLQNRRVELRIR
jgi:outer membrane protein OmpA-like peptidoglycan-associated protein